MNCLHKYCVDIKDVELPKQFNNPFKYTPHLLCELAANEVKNFIALDKELCADVAKGKMLGVLVVRDSVGEIGYLAAFSGLLCGSSVPRENGMFVPPVFDFHQPNGYFKCEEA